MFADFYKYPPSYSRVQKAIDWLGNEYKALKIFPIGKSVNGRDITALCVGNPHGSTLYIGAVWGMEWLTTLLLLRFCETVAEALQNGGTVSDVNVERALRRRSLTIIPCLNPDGVEIVLSGAEAAGAWQDLVEKTGGDAGCRTVWNANARGVDIGRNLTGSRGLSFYPAPKDACAEGYEGPYPGSEPETAAVTTFCLTYQPRSLYTLHNNGEKIYYQYDNSIPDRSHMIAQILASSSGYTAVSHSSVVSGTEALRQDARNGLKNWFIKTLGNPGFAIEVGMGGQQLTAQDLNKIYRRTEEMLMIAALL